MQGMDETLGLQDAGAAEICEELDVRRRAAQAALEQFDGVMNDSPAPQRAPVLAPSAVPEVYWHMQSRGIEAAKMSGDIPTQWM